MVSAGAKVGTGVGGSVGEGVGDGVGVGVVTSRGVDCGLLTVPPFTGFEKLSATTMPPVTKTTTITAKATIMSL